MECLFAILQRCVTDLTRYDLAIYNECTYRGNGRLMQRYHIYRIVLILEMILKQDV